MEVRRTPEGAELTVAEAPRSDVGLGRARIDETTRQRLGVDVGGYIEIAGKKRTVASVSPLLSEDEGKALLRIDGLVRKNANVVPGDTVLVNKVNVRRATEVVLAAIFQSGHTITFASGIERFVARGLLNRPLRKGDTVIVPGIALMGGAMPFAVVRTMPEGAICVAEETAISLRRAPFHEAENLPPEELFQAFADRLSESLSDLMEEFGGDLSKLTGETGERAGSIMKKLRVLMAELRAREGR